MNNDLSFTTTADTISGGYVYIDGSSGPKIELCWPTKYNERSKDMMGLYEVYVVDKKKRVFIGKETVITDDATRAGMIATRRMNIDVENENLAMQINMIIQWEDKKPKEVKIVKE